MEMKLKSLKISNFKAISNLTITPNGGNLAIFGRNKLGKTTIYDSFLWLLFGKNSNGETQFTIKPTFMPLETETSVEGEFTVGGKPLILRKALVPKYVKTTGEYKSTEQECYINSVPKKIREYEATIGAVINEEQFKLLTNPKYFTENLDWKKRREILFSICGTKSDAEIAAENPSFSVILPDLETSENTTDFIKCVNAQVKKNSERVNIIPRLIQENAMHITSTDPIETLKKSADSITEEITRTRLDIANFKAWKPDTAALENLKKELANLENENKLYRDKQTAAKLDYENRLKALEAREKALTSLREIMSSKQAELESTRQKYAECQNKEWDSNVVCPTCGQALPEKSLAKSKEAFESHKLRELNALLDLEKVQSEALESYKFTYSAQLDELAHYKSETNMVKPPKAEITNMPDFVKRSIGIKTEINKIVSCTENPHAADITKLESKLAEYTAKQNAINAEIAKVHGNAAANERIAVLKDEQVHLREEQALLQQKSDLLAEFIKYKTDSVTEKINSMFNYTKFKLFEPNKTNDGVAECCDAVAFGSNRYGDINAAGKIIVGIDIIRTLATHYGVSVPLFVDNVDGLDSNSYSELVKLIGGDMQLITLRVSEDEALRTEEF